MPTYEYQREDGTTFEVLQRISDEPLQTCPVTGQRVKRVIGGGAGLIFKGSGFYLTDYARKGNGNGKDRAGAAPSSPAADAASGSGSTSSSSTGKGDAASKPSRPAGE
jgi:putative FmdB family regulatory protein